MKRGNFSHSVPAVISDTFSILIPRLFPSTSHSPVFLSLGEDLHLILLPLLTTCPFVFLFHCWLFRVNVPYSYLLFLHYPLFLNTSRSISQYYLSICNVNNDLISTVRWLFSVFIFFDYSATTKLAHPFLLYSFSSIDPCLLQTPGGFVDQKIKQGYCVGTFVTILKWKKQKQKPFLASSS